MIFVTNNLDANRELCRYVATGRDLTLVAWSEFKVEELRNQILIMERPVTGFSDPRIAYLLPYEQRIIIVGSVPNWEEMYLLPDWHRIDSIYAAIMKALAA